MFGNLSKPSCVFVYVCTCVCVCVYVYACACVTHVKSIRARPMINYLAVQWYVVMTQSLSRTRANGKQSPLSHDLPC